MRQPQKRGVGGSKPTPPKILRRRGSQFRFGSSADSLNVGAALQLDFQQQTPHRQLCTGLGQIENLRTL
jgi:hypothetical protein